MTPTSRTAKTDLLLRQTRIHFSRLEEAKVKITVTDKEGNVIRELEGPGASGVNRTNWDLRYDSPAEPTPEQLEAMAAGYDFGPRGPFVEPGEYSIKIKAGDKEGTQRVTVEEDPPTRRLYQSDRGPTQCCLAASALSYDRDRLRLAEHHRDVVDGADPHRW